MVRSVPRNRAFGISTKLHLNSRLSREHLLEIGAHGFEAVELFAVQTHFDFHNPNAVADLQQWLVEAGLELHGVHAPVAESFGNGRWGRLLSLASADTDARAHALAEAEAALYVARRVPFGALIVHLGLPRTLAGPGDNGRDGARRSVEALQEKAEPLGVRIVLEVIPNELSRAASLVHFVEQVLDTADVGICLDFGHAHMDGDLIDAIETVSEHLAATHVHDNRGRSDDHLLPFEGTIDWAGALTAIQKVGYDGTLLLEPAGRGPAKETLQRARKARERMEKLLAH
jgi:sugar phosphate isomerase/epimerase